VEAARGFAGVLEAVLRFVEGGSRPFCLGGEAVSKFLGFVFAIALLRNLSILNIRYCRSQTLLSVLAVKIKMGATDHERGELKWEQLPV